MNGPLETRFQYSPKKRDEANRTTNLCKRSRRLRCVLHSYANPALSQLHVFFLTMRTTTNRKRPDHPPTSPETIGGLGPGQKPAPPPANPPLHEWRTHNSAVCSTPMVRGQECVCATLTEGLSTVYSLLQYECRQHI